LIKLLAYKDIVPFLAHPVYIKTSLMSGGRMVVEPMSYTMSYELHYSV